MYGGLSFTALPHHLKQSRKLRDVEWSIETATDNGRVMGYVPTAVYREYNPDSAGTRRDECLVETHLDRSLVGEQRD